MSQRKITNLRPPARLEPDDDVDVKSDAAQAPNTLSPWVPGVLDPKLPPYLALISALENDIREGLLPFGAQLPPHRTLASQLNLSLSTVTKAYREANARGIVAARVGQGTFVARRPSSDVQIRPVKSAHFGVNLAPDVGQKNDLRAAMAEIGRTGSGDRMFAYDAHQGLREHRTALAEWIATPGFRPSPELLFATNGAQHGLSLALSILCQPGEHILVEQLTYVGFKALANLHGYKLTPVEMDAEGMVPKALDQKLEQTGARVVYAMPTLHSPTGKTMGEERRRKIAEVLVRHDAMLIEDDVYAFLLNPKKVPIAALIPDRTVYLASLSKVFELGFRAGILVIPPALVERARLALRASAWSATPLLFELVSNLISSGALEKITHNLRQETRRRLELFRQNFPEQRLPHGGDLAGYHVWLEVTDGWTAEDVFFAARNQELLLTPPGSATIEGKAESGIRICLGACDPSQLERGLTALRQILSVPARSNLSVV